MTGYGRGAAEGAGRRVVVEIRSVNHRYLDLKLRGAALAPELEERVTSRVKARVSRGSITLSVRTEGGGQGGGMRIDLDAARRAYAELGRLAAALELEPTIGLGLLAAQPGVVVADEADGDDEALTDLVSRASDQAIDALGVMRDAEGAALARDMGGRLDRLAELNRTIRGQAVIAPEEAHRRLGERLARLMGSSKVAVDEARLAQEVAILADRVDVTEELVRAQSHIEQLVALLAQPGEAVGRRLDFLVQELGREYNTVASKAQSAEIARAVVEAKAELERIREQVQNIE